MRSSSILRCAAAGAVALVAGALLPATSQAQSTSKGDPSCLILEGAAGLVRHQTYVQDGLTKKTVFDHGADLSDPKPHTHEVEYKTYRVDPTDSADVDVDVVLGTAGAPAGNCTGYRYRLRVLDEQQNFVTEVVVPGTTTGGVSWRTTVPYPYAEGRFAYVSVTAEGPNGRVVDVAPSDKPAEPVNLTGGGAKSSFA